MNQELPDVQVMFRKSRTRDQIANIHWVIEKAKEFQKQTSTSASLTTLKPLTVCMTTNQKILKEMGKLDHHSCLLRNVYVGQEAAVKTGHGAMVVSKIGKECIKAIHCQLAYLTYMQSTSWEMPVWMKHKHQDCKEKYQ